MRSTSLPLPHLTENDLKELGLPIGPRRKVIAAIAALREETSPPQRPQTAARAVDAQAERRQVTVLFADLVGYTRLSRMLDAEQIHSLLERFFTCVDRIIEEHGGRVDKHIGDCGDGGVWGAPVAHGNDAERTIHAALAIREAMVAVSSEVGQVVQVHIGVAGGEVLASGGGSASHREYTVTGNSVNLAARLTETAGPGEILVSDRLWQALAEQFEGADADLLNIAGFAAPVRAWRLAGLRRRLTRPVARRTPIRGRAVSRSSRGLPREWTRASGPYPRRGGHWQDPVARGVPGDRAPAGLPLSLGIGA